MTYEGPGIRNTETRDGVRVLVGASSLGSREKGERKADLEAGALGLGRVVAVVAVLVGVEVVLVIVIVVRCTLQTHIPSSAIK